MDIQQIAQTVHYLKKFTKLANDFFDEGDHIHKEYWKGQVMGICKIVDLLGNTEIDTRYYLNLLP